MLTAQAMGQQGSTHNCERKLHIFLSAAGRSGGSDDLLELRDRESSICPLI